MRRGNEVPIVGEDGVDVEPGFDHAQAAFAPEVAREAAPGGLVEDQAFGLTVALR